MSASTSMCSGGGALSSKARDRRAFLGAFSAAASSGAVVLSDAGFLARPYETMHSAMSVCESADKQHVTPLLASCGLQLVHTPHICELQPANYIY